MTRMRFTTFSKPSVPSQILKFAVLLPVVIGTTCSLTAGEPELPAENGVVQLETQSWPYQPGPRQVTTYVNYPGGKLENVTAETGLMLNLHNWGGTKYSGAGNPQELTSKLNVVAISVDYVQSGKWKEPVDGPYDFGVYQAIDALRGLSWGFRQLEKQGIPFDKRRIYSSGGSGGGNVTLMCNKLAPHTFTCIVDICGMPRLTDDIAYNLPGGSFLNAHYSQDPAHPFYLTPGNQELRFIGNPEHLRVMKETGNSAKIVVIHGDADKACLFEDAREMVQNFQNAGLDVEPLFITKDKIDGVIFKTNGHSLGNRTAMMTEIGGKYIKPESSQFLLRETPTDFERQQDVVYPTSDGRFVISYDAGIPAIRFEKKPQ